VLPKLLRLAAFRSSTHWSSVSIILQIIDLHFFQPTSLKARLNIGNNHKRRSAPPFTVRVLLPKYVKRWIAPAMSPSVSGSEQVFTCT